MFATTLVHVSLTLLPLLQLPQPPRECQLEVLAPHVLEDRAVAEFDAKVHAYATLHRRLARALPMTEMRDEEGWFVQDDLRAALIAARPYAREGGFFTPRVAEVFSNRIERALLHARVGTAERVHAPLPGEPGPTVNQPLSAAPGSVQWPELVRALPVLPAELDYMFWATDLVLVDVAANLVVDVLPNALPAGAPSHVMYR